MSLETVEIFIKNFLNRSITFIIKQRLTPNQLTNDNFYNLSKIQSEIEEILDEDYTKGYEFSLLGIMNRNFILEFVYKSDKSHYTILLERWEFLCEYSFNFLNILREEKCQDEYIIENMIKNIKNTIKTLTNINVKKNNFKLGFKIYNSRKNKNEFIDKFKVIKLNTSAKKFSIYVKLEYLENLDLNLFQKRRRCFSEGDIEEFEIKINQNIEIDENYFNSNKQLKEEEDSFKIKYKFKDNNIMLNEIVDKYTELKETMAHSNTILDFWKCLNMYINKTSQYI